MQLGAWLDSIGWHRPPLLDPAQVYPLQTGGQPKGGLAGAVGGGREATRPGAAAAPSARAEPAGVTGSGRKKARKMAEALAATAAAAAPSARAEPAGAAEPGRKKARKIDSAFVAAAAAAAKAADLPAAAAGTSAGPSAPALPVGPRVDKRKMGKAVAAAAKQKLESEGVAALVRMRQSKRQKRMTRGGERDAEAEVLAMLSSGLPHGHWKTPPSRRSMGSALPPESSADQPDAEVVYGTQQDNEGADVESEEGVGEEEEEEEELRIID